MKKLLLLILSSLMLISCRYANDASDTAFDQFKASALLAKYETFKDLASAIDKKKADIAVYEQELLSMDVKDKDDKYYYQQRKSEMLGLVSMHNQLVSEYNALMSKSNYAFTNVGQMPQSNMTPLPREYQDYILHLN